MDSHCLAISQGFARIVPFADRESIEKLVAKYLKSLKTKGASNAEGIRVWTAYDVLTLPTSGHSILPEW